MKIEHAIDVQPEDYQYLVAQRGALDDMLENSMMWMARYADMLFAEFERIAPHVEDLQCEAILDIGSGLGGIDILLNRLFGGECRVTLVDGVDDPPQMTLHRKTFNHMGVARRFQEANGVKYFSYIDANEQGQRAAIKYDLIVSQQSWCFHLAPETHLDLALSACHEKTHLIIDVRIDKPDWLLRLAQYFDHKKIYVGRKAVTLLLWPNEWFRTVLRP